MYLTLSTPLLAQVNPWDDTFPKEIHDFLVKQGIQIDVDALSIKGFEAFLNKEEDIDKEKQQLSTTLFIDNHFLTGKLDSTSIYPSKLYTNIGLGTELSIANIPMSLQGNLIVEETAINTDLSSLVFRLNHGQFLEQLKQKYLPQPNIEELLNLSTNPLGLDVSELQELKQELVYESYRRILAHPQFIAYKQRVSAVKDSLQRSEGLEVVQQIEQKYQELLVARKKASTALGGIQEKAISFKEKLTSYQDVNNLKEQLEKQQLNGLERALLWTKDLTLGFSSLNDSEFSVRHATINGIQYAYDNNKHYATVAYGRQALPYPSVRLRFFQDRSHRKYLFAKAGVQSNEGDRVGLSLLQVEDSTQNRVVTFLGEKSVNQEQALSVEAAVSNYELLEQQQISPATSALSVKWKLESKILPLHLALGYFRIGADFITLGNPFLLTNKQGASIDVEAYFLKEKLQLKTSGRLGKTLDINQQANARDWQLLGEVNYRFGKQNLISARIMPNVLYQGAYQDRLEAQQTIYTAQANIVSDLKKGQLISITQISNIRSGFEWVDSVQVAQTAYAYLQESYVFPSGNQFTIAAQFSKEDTLLQSDYQWIIGKSGAIQLGGQWTKQFGIEQYGVIAGINCQLTKQLNIQTRLTARAGDRQEFFGNTMLQMRF